MTAMSNVARGFAATLFFLAGLVMTAGVFRVGAGKAGFISVLAAVIMLISSAVTAHSPGLRVLEAILGTLIMALAGLLLFYSVLEASYAYQLRYHIASIAALLCGGITYFVYRRKAR